jgi:hypothetical protein
MAQKRATTGTGKAYSNRPAKGTGPSVSKKRVTSRPKQGYKMVELTNKQAAKYLGAEGPKKTSPVKKRGK